MAKNQFDYGQATNKLLGYWETYHTDYQSLRSRYSALIEKKKKRGYILRNKKDGPILRDYPVGIELLEKASREDVVEYIEDMTPTELKNLIYEIETEVVAECSGFNILRRRVRFHEQDIADQERPSTYLYEIKVITD